MWNEKILKLITQYFPAAMVVWFCYRDMKNEAAYAELQSRYDKFRDFVYQVEQSRNSVLEERINSRGNTQIIYVPDSGYRTNAGDIKWRPSR